MRAAILALLLLLPLKAYAWHLIELDEVSSEYRHYLRPNYNAYFPQEEKDGLNLRLDSTVAKYFIWNSEVHGTSDDAAYRQIGLQMSVGVRVSRYLDLTLNHHSQHLLDEGDAWGRHFPCENWVGVKIYFYRQDRKETLIP